MIIGTGISGVGPSISIVIPTHNRCDGLRRVLDALAGQTVPACRFEVVVSMDRVTDGTQDMLASGEWPFAVMPIVPQGHGAAAARNAGAAIARGGRILFLDDDIVAAPGLVEAHLRLGDRPDIVVVGHSVPAEDGPGWFQHNRRRWWEELFQDLAQPDRRSRFTDCLSGNISLDRELFHRAGGFDAEFLCREDYELGYRLILAGGRFRFAADAVGVHEDRSDHARSFRRAEAEGRADAQFAIKHPEVLGALRLANLVHDGRRARLARSLVFAYPRLHAGMVRMAMAMQAVARPLGLRRVWGKLDALLRASFYFRGVRDVVPSTASYMALRRVEPPDASRDASGVDGTYPAARKLPTGDWLIGEQLAAPWLEDPTPAQLVGLLRFRSGVAPSRHVPTTGEDDPLARLERSFSGWRGRTRDDDGVAVGELDVATWAVSTNGPSASFPARLLVRHGLRPIGWVYVDPAPDASPALNAAAEILKDEWIASGVCRMWIDQGAASSRVDPFPKISVVVCTRNRTANLERCLDALLRMEEKPFEIIVVDNAPSDEATERLVERYPAVRYAREDRPGLDWARNRGIREARGEVVAFTDDDVVVDRFWVASLGRAFANRAANAVTGLVVPLKLDTRARIYFEDTYGGMGKGVQPRLIDPAVLGVEGALWSSQCGVGANMAFRRELLIRLGGFDPGLDVGTATRGGGDIELFHRVLRSGEIIHYDPRAMVWHEHRADPAMLAGQLRDNGSGFVAFLLTCWRRRSVPRLQLVRFATVTWAWGWLLKRLLAPGPHSRRLVLAEIAGALSGRRHYKAARARAVAEGFDECTPWTDALADAGHDR